ncbi:MAG TPA: NmrA family NAD(P)-binding protein [Blastocatellia bacterium]|nr:NmrA family NAD(P)-binding protein [Blastocatellia bacterium]
MSIVITTPTGNIGRRALQQLLEAGADVSVIVRQPEKLSDSIRSRVKIHQGSLTDAGLVTKAFQGAKAALWLTPPSLTHPDVAAYHSEMGAVAATAIKESKIPYVVNVSSAGAHLENAGPISGLRAIERRLKEAAENIVHLRPGFFMENFLQQIEPIKNDGAIYQPLPGDRPYPIIATQDIGDVAAQLLLERNWRGHQIRGLHGPVDLTFAEATKILSESIGKPVKYVQITPDQAYQAFLGMGASPGFAKALVEMYQALSRPNAIAEPRTPETTTTTTMREWSDKVFRPLFTA